MGAVLVYAQIWQTDRPFDQ